MGLFKQGLGPRELELNMSQFFRHGNGVATWRRPFAEAHFRETTAACNLKRGLVWSSIGREERLGEGNC